MIDIAEILDQDAAQVQFHCNGFVITANLDPHQVMESACCIEFAMNVLPAKIEL